MKADVVAELGLEDKVVYANLRSEIELSATDWLQQTRRPKAGNMVGV
jgi:hypothetical protein